MFRVTRTLRYHKQAPVVVDGPDLSPDLPHDVFEYVIPGGRASPFGTIFSGHGVHVESLFDTTALNPITKARLAITSRLKRTVHIPGDVVIAANPYYRNYYHFLLECLTRIFLVKERLDCPKTTIIFPDDASSFHRQWFKSLGFESCVRYLPNSVIAKGDRIITSSFAAPGDNHHCGVLRDFQAWIRDLWKTNIPVSNETRGSKHEKIFIGRKAGLRRTILNLADTQEVCADFGYQYLELDGLNIIEQGAVFAEASHIVAIHGAGLANLIFSSDGTSVVELRNRNFHNRTFDKMAKCLGLNHFALSCEPSSVGEDLRIQNHSDISVDLAALRQTLAALA